MFGVGGVGVEAAQLVFKIMNIVCNCKILEHLTHKTVEISLAYPYNEGL